MSQAGGSRAALTGVASILLVVASFFIGGESPDTEASSQEIVSYFSDEGKLTVATILLGLGAVLFLFFAGFLRSVLRSAEAPDGWLSAVAFGGGVAVSIGMLIFAGLSFTLIDAVDTLDPAAVQAINALSFDLFFPLAGGIVTLLVAASLSSLQTKALPAWLAWAGLVIGVATFTPLGFFAFLASLAWVLVTSVVLLMRRAGARPPGTAGLE